MKRFARSLVVAVALVDPRHAFADSFTLCVGADGVKSNGRLMALVRKLTVD